MTRLSEILDVDLLHEMLKQKYVRHQTHPKLPYCILNYTEHAQFDRVWNDVTEQCRGLIYNYENNEVVARPFRKFHNLGSSEAPTLNLDTPVTVAEKVDGSLGISYRSPVYGTKLNIATRGSFTSEQAVRANEILREKDYSYFNIPTGVTLLFEIVYPQNRIVVDYGSQEDLILLGAVDIQTGNSLDPEDAAEQTGWAGPVAPTFQYKTLGEALAAPDRENAEGFVIRVKDTETRVKLKQEDYVSRHKLVTGLTTRSVWELLKSGKSVSDLISDLPDEFHAWASDTTKGLEAEVKALRDYIEFDYQDIKYRLNTSSSLSTRADFAKLAARTQYPWAMFSLLDEKKIGHKLWELVKPEAGNTPHSKLGGSDE